MIEFMFLKIAVLCLIVFVLLLIFDIATDKLPRFLKKVGEILMFSSIGFAFASILAMIWRLMP